MAISIKNYTNRFLVIAILFIMAIWAILFYAVIMDEVYDNIDDGLKNQKILIIREAYIDTDLIEKSAEFGVNQFRILPTTDQNIVDKNEFSKEFIYMPYDEEDEPYRILRTGFYSKAGTPYSLEIRTSTVEEDDFLINLGISLSVLYIVIVLSIMVINHYVLKKAWGPFRQILNNLGKYRFGEPKSFEIVPTQVKEFTELNAKIQHMISRNEDVFVSQKRFIENASHELQTPIAIMINKLDLLLDDDGFFNEAQLTKLAEAKQSLLRMSNLNKSLLMLSRIENHQYADTQVVNFNELIKGLLEDVDYLIAHRNITVTLLEHGNFEQMYNRDLALILLSNLIRNAIKYNLPQEGKLIVQISEEEIKISNTSVYNALDPNYIFERFHKGRQDSQSNGLGLSIVKSIVNNNPHVALKYEFVSFMHVFSLRKLD